MKITKKQLKQIIKEELSKVINEGEREKFIKGLAKEISRAVPLDMGAQDELINTFIETDLESLEPGYLTFYKRKFINRGLELPSGEEIAAAVEADEEEAEAAAYRRAEREKEKADSKGPYNPSWERGYGRGLYQGD